jgi:uncharacterized damage-inducible protein DinB
MQRRLVEPVPAATPEIGRWLWALEDTRRRTKEALAGLAPAALAWAPPGGGNSIGTLLYHLALIEAGYLYDDVVGLRAYPDEAAALSPSPDRDDGGALTAVRAVALDAHLRRLDDVRRPRALPGYTITPEWTLHHVMQHEAEHRGQIMTLRDFAEPARPSATGARG